MSTSDSPAAATAPIAADTQSKPPGADGSSATGWGSSDRVCGSPAVRGAQVPRTVTGGPAIEDRGGGTRPGSVPSCSG